VVSENDMRQRLNLAGADDHLACHLRVKRAKIVAGAGFVEIEDLNSADAGLGEIECLAVGSEFGVARRLVEWDRSHDGTLCKVDHDQGKVAGILRRDVRGLPVRTDRDRMRFRHSDS